MVDARQLNTRVKNSISSTDHSGRNARQLNLQERAVAERGLHPIRNRLDWNAGWFGSPFIPNCRGVASAHQRSREWVPMGGGGAIVGEGEWQLAP